MSLPEEGRSYHISTEHFVKTVTVQTILQEHTMSSSKTDDPDGGQSLSPLLCPRGSISLDQAVVASRHLAHSLSSLHLHMGSQ